MKRSKFSLSHYKLFSCDMGQLVPIAAVPVLPGDTFQHATSALVRVSPLLSPVMHPVRVRIHHWYVPNRLVWDNWEDFITGGPDGENADAHPYITFLSGTNGAEGSLADYMGVPPTGGSGIVADALPFRAYNLIWNEFYRDQDLQSELVISAGDGADTTSNVTLQNVCWEKDYFTTSRLDPQKGVPVSLPLGTSATVKRSSNATYWDAYNEGTNTKAGAGDVQVSAAGAVFNSPPGDGLSFDPKGTLYADLSTATAATINDLRYAMAIQRFEEARARYGSRYTEYLRYLGVRSSDARLQRPEYLGGGKQTIQFSEVLQTGVTTDGDDEEGVGNIRGHGISAMRSNRYRRFFEEHGWVITTMSVLPKTIYGSGLARKFLGPKSKVSYFQKELQHIGQQEVLNQEAYAGMTSPGGVFGYQDRYDEYRREESGIGGEFRTTLNHWHYARLFNSDFVLNSDFVKAVPTKRVNADQTSDCLWVMANHSIQARRIVAPEGTSFGL